VLVVALAPRRQAALWEDPTTLAVVYGAGTMPEYKQILSSWCLSLPSTVLSLSLNNYGALSVDNAGTCFCTLFNQTTPQCRLRAHWMFCLLVRGSYIVCRQYQRISIYPCGVFGFARSRDSLVEVHYRLRVGKGNAARMKSYSKGDAVTDCELRVSANWVRTFAQANGLACAPNLPSGHLRSAVFLLESWDIIKQSYPSCLRSASASVMKVRPSSARKPYRSSKQRWEYKKSRPMLNPVSSSPRWLYRSYLGLHSYLRRMFAPEHSRIRCRTCTRCLRT
jgi:hypothetical protein